MKLITRGFVYAIFHTFLTIAANALPIDEYKKISANGKFGLALATTNEIIISPIFDDIGWSDQSLSVIDGVIGFKENETWGLVNLQGKKVFNSQYTALYPLTKSLLIAGKRSRYSILNKYGIINTKGKIVSALEFNSFTPVDGNAIVSKRVNSYEKVGFINANGKILIPFEYESINKINSRLLAVENQKNLKAIFDIDGTQKSEFQFESISPLDQENFLVSLYNRKGVVDASGQQVIAPIYKDIKINDGKLEGTSFDKWTVLNGQNQIIKSYQFDKIRPVSNGTYAVQISNNMGLMTEGEESLAYSKNVSLSASQHDLVVVQENQYFGVLDKSGMTVLPRQSDSVWVYEEFIFSKIEKADRQSWTPYDKSGKKIGYFQYEHFERENANRLRAYRTGKWGLLDMAGNEASPFLYDSLGPLKGGLAKVFYLNNYGVINENGIWVVTPYKDEITLTDKNILYRQGSENGIMDKDGNVLYRSQQQIKLIGQLFKVPKEDGQFVLLNEEGNRAFVAAMDTVFHIKPSLYVFRQNNEWRILNNTNHSVVTLGKDIEQIKGFEEDLISVKIDNHWGYIEEGGQLRIANRYDSVQYFSEGLSAIKLIGKWGFIDKQENIVIQPNYDEVEPFYGHLSMVRKGKLYGLIDRDGKEILDVKYRKIERLDDYILLYSESAIGLANKQGVVLRSPQYTAVKQINKTQFVVSKGNKHGVISIKGLDIIPLTYDEIIPFNDKFLVKEEAPKTAVKLN